MDFGTLTLYRRGEQPQPFRLRLGSLSIGGDPSADISIDDAMLERFHARVVCTPAGCQLTDLGSSGGTLVNKERLPPHAPRLLRDGDRIQLGRVGLLYAAPPGKARSSGDAPSPAETDRTPAETDRTPAETGRTPSETGRTSAETDRTPAETDRTPAETDRTPAETGRTPAETDRPSPSERAAPSGASRSSGSAPRPTAQATVTATAPPLDDWNALFQVPVVPAGGQGATMLPGNRRRRRPRHEERELPYEAEDYLALLPPIYHDDRFLRRFLLIFKSVLDPLDRQIAQIAHYFDPRTAPEHMLPWLAGWVDLVLDERWPEARRRELIGAASVLYRWRGTRRGLGDYLRIYTGVEPRIVEQGQEAKGEPALAPHTFRVIIEAPDLSAIDRGLVERIIELEKPAHTAYELELRKSS